MNSIDIIPRLRELADDLGRTTGEYLPQVKTVESAIREIVTLRKDIQRKEIELVAFKLKTGNNVSNWPARGKMPDAHGTDSGGATT